MPQPTVLPPAVVTDALRSVAARVPGALDRVWALVYPWVVQRAALLLAGEVATDFGDARDLAHEAFLRLKPVHLATCVDRWHLIRIATRAMRQALVDQARYRQRAKRAALRVVPLDEPSEIGGRSSGDPDQPLDLALALDDLQQINEQVAEVATLRLLGGLSFVEIARSLRRSEAWARGNWEHAQAWLRVRFGR